VKFSLDKFNEGEGTNGKSLGWKEVGSLRSCVEAIVDGHNRMMNVLCSDNSGDVRFDLGQLDFIKNSNGKNVFMYQQRK